jgi:hypothetical protein
MSNPMTRKEKLAYIKECGKLLLGGSPEYKAGNKHFTGDINKMSDNPYREHGRSEDPVLRAKCKDWFNGFENAYYVKQVKQELKTTVPVTFQQVLDLPRLKSEWCNYKVGSLIEHQMIDGVTEHHIGLSDDKFGRIDVEDIFYDNGDGERTRTLGVMSFDGIPVMLFNHCGRGNFEYTREFIIDGEVFKQAVLYIHSVIIDNEGEEGIEVYSLEDDAEKLINFYGSRLEIKEIK